MNTSKSSQAIGPCRCDDDDEVERWGPAFVYFVPFLRYGYDIDIDFDIDPHSRSHDPMHLDIHDQTRISGPVVIVPCIASNSRVQTACEQVHPQLYMVIKSCFHQMRLTDTTLCTKPVRCVYYTIKSVFRLSGALPKYSNIHIAQDPTPCSEARSFILLRHAQAFSDKDPGHASLGGGEL
jgi:hypothetical protein